MNNEPLKIEAIVSANGNDRWFVLNREPVFVYEKREPGLVAQDGPFIDVLSGPKGSGAFGGRVFDLPCTDGTTATCSGQYWHASLKGLIEVGYRTIEDLKKCYVFNGCSADPELLKLLVDEYRGAVYPYDEYEKIICYDQERRKLLDWVFRLEKDKKNLIEQAKQWSQKARQGERS